MSVAGDSNCSELDSSPLDVAISSLKWEDSGIVIANGPLTPEDETKQLDTTNKTTTTTTTRTGKQQNTDDSNEFNARRRSSAGNYSFSSDGQHDCNNGGAWLSDTEDGGVNQVSGDGAGHEEEDMVVEMAVSGSSEGRPSVGSSPGQDDSTPDQETVTVKQPERPRVEFRKGIRCNDVLKAIEILATAYKLPDVTFRQCYRQWSSWGISEFSGLSFNRRHGDTVDDCRELKEICVSIERRHREIAEILRKLLELDAANKAEAEALVRNTVSPDSTSQTGSPIASPGDLRSPTIGPAGDETTGGVDTGCDGSRPGMKRRNPFSRAVHALRKRFARPGQHGVPTAA